MKRLTVHASREYDVLVGRDLLNRAGDLAREALKKSGGRVMLVSEDRVAPLYLERATESFSAAGFSVFTYVFEAGESSKNMNTLAGLLNRMAEIPMTRSDFVVALGGGVVGDLAGFAASVYARGIRFVQIPTTLLAMVDASVGGKTAVDLPAGKNMAGTFWQPSLVLCDLDLLDTLPGEVFRCGVAEIIKYAFIGDRELYDRLCQSLTDHLEWIVARSVADKRDLVEADERDTGARQLLNLGHTIGHAVERCSDFRIPHGDAVAIGMHRITSAAVKKGRCGKDVLVCLDALLDRYGLPKNAGFDADSLTQAALGDKKRQGDSITLVLPCGMCKSERMAVPVGELRDWIAAGGDAEE